MNSTLVSERSAPEAGALAAEEYNYHHFRAQLLAADAARMMRSDWIQPGREAPDFELPCADGGSLRLSSLRGKPVLLRFGSPT